MRIVKNTLFGLVCFPFALILAIGAALVAVALFVIYLLVALAYPTEAEWSA